MNIDKISQTSSIQTNDIKKNAESRPGNVTAGNAPVAKPSTTGTQVRLSRRSQNVVTTDDSHDVDCARLAKIREQMDNGELQTDSDQIASALVNDIIHFS